MAHLFLDTEFNGHGGELISLALYDVDLLDFYEVVEAPAHIDPWVAKHVIPVLRAQPISRAELTSALRAYLTDRLPHGPIHVYADWPADFVHFFAALMLEGHYEVDIPISAHLFHSGPIHPEVPHNALSDAKALAAWYLANRALD